MISEFMAPQLHRVGLKSVTIYCVYFIYFFLIAILPQFKF